MTSGSARAFEFGIGIEGGGNFTHLEQDFWGPELGLILEQRFQLPVVALTLWEDVQGLTDFHNSQAFGSFDIGLRGELSGHVFTPYVGILINDGIQLPRIRGGEVNVPGLGGDLGIDLALVFLRFGLELRAYETLISPNGYANAFVLQGLLSVRAEI